MLQYEEKIVQVAQCKDKISLSEKQRIELLDYKDSISSKEKDLCLESLAKAISKLSLKDDEIKYLKKDINQKDTRITSLKEVVVQKETLIKEAHVERSQGKEKLEKANKKLISKVPLIKAKKALWGKLTIEITKFRSYLEFVQEEYEMARVSTKK